MDQVFLSNPPDRTDTTDKTQRLSADIAVIGGGPAGIAAALTARTEGASVLLIERSGTLGGMSGGGLLNVFCGSSSSALLRRLREETGWQDRFDPLWLRCRYFELLEQAGVTVLTEALPTGVGKEGSRIGDIALQCGGVSLTLSAGVYIDATGDGDIAAMAGIPFCLGREKDHLSQPISLEFLVGGVDSRQAVYPNTFFGNPEYEQALAAYVADGRVPAPAGHVILLPGIHPGTAAVNMTNATGADATDPLSRSRANALTHRQIPGILDFLRECVPGYGNCYLEAIGSAAGVRESRHPAGLYCLTEKDILAQRVFDDWVVPRAEYPFGIHAPTGVASAPDEAIPAYHGERYTIPYRCLLPESGADNLLFAGRDISCNHLAHASLRVMPICMAIGEAAGIGAALAIRDGTEPRAVNARDIQDLLIRRLGCPPPEPKPL